MFITTSVAAINMTASLERVEDALWIHRPITCSILVYSSCYLNRISKFQLPTSIQRREISNPLVKSHGAAVGDIPLLVHFAAGCFGFRITLLVWGFSPPEPGQHSASQLAQHRSLCQMKGSCRDHYTSVLVASMSFGSSLQGPQEHNRVKNVDCYVDAASETLASRSWKCWIWHTGCSVQHQTPQDVTTLSCYGSVRLSCHFSGDARSSGQRTKTEVGRVSADWTVLLRSIYNKLVVTCLIYRGNGLDES
nr:hypothetical protein CFP56_63791 [Quercus suber]